MTHIKEVFLWRLIKKKKTVSNVIFKLLFKETRKKEMKLRFQVYR